MTNACLLFARLTIDIQIKILTADLISCNIMFIFTNIALIFLFVICPLMYCLKYIYIKYCNFSAFGSLLYKAAEKYVNTTESKFTGL